MLTASQLRLNCSNRFQFTMAPSFPPVDDALALLPALLGAVLIVVALLHALAIRAQGQPAYIRHLSAQGYPQRRIAARLNITRYAVRCAL